jgi:hypothetical protein
MNESRSRLLPLRRWQQWVLGLAVAFVAAAITVAHLFDEPLRRRIEAGINESLKGYG